MQRGNRFRIQCPDGVCRMGNGKGSAQHLDCELFSIPFYIRQTGFDRLRFQFLKLFFIECKWDFFLMVFNFHGS